MIPFLARRAIQDAARNVARRALRDEIAELRAAVARVALQRDAAREEAEHRGRCMAIRDADVVRQVSDLAAAQEALDRCRLDGVLVTADAYLFMRNQLDAMRNQHGEAVRRLKLAEQGAEAARALGAAAERERIIRLVDDHARAEWQGVTALEELAAELRGVRP